MKHPLQKILFKLTSATLKKSHLTFPLNINSDSKILLLGSMDELHCRCRGLAYHTPTSIYEIIDTNIPPFSKLWRNKLREIKSKKYDIAIVSQNADSSLQLLAICARIPIRVLIQQNNSSNIEKEKYFNLIWKGEVKSFLKSVVK